MVRTRRYRRRRRKTQGGVRKKKKKKTHQEQGVEKVCVKIYSDNADILQE